MKYLLIFSFLIIISCTENYNTKVILKTSLEKSPFKENCVLNKIESYPVAEKHSDLDFQDIERIATGYPITKDELIATFGVYKKNKSFYNITDFKNSNIYNQVNVNYGIFLKVFTPIIFNKEFYIIPYNEYKDDEVRTHFYVKRGEEEYQIINISFGCF